MRRFFWLLFLLPCFFKNTTTLTAQTFRGGVVAGFNLSEFLGEDISSGVGWDLGLKVSTAISPRWEAATELLYSQAGAYVLPEFYPVADYGKVRLDYLELPFYFTYAAFPKADYFQKKFSFGLSYAQLVNYEVEDVRGVDLTPQIVWNRKATAFGHFGVSHVFNKHIEVNFRAALAKNQAYWAWTLAFRGIYTI